MSPDQVHLPTEYSENEEQGKAIKFDYVTNMPGITDYKNKQKFRYSKDVVSSSYVGYTFFMNR